MYRAVFILALCGTAAHVGAINPVDLTSKSPYSAQTSPTASQCTPIFLSTLSRHGSRTASSESKYLAPQNYLQEAADADLLTDEGRAVLAWSQQLHDLLDSRNVSWGGLTAVGRNEHHALGGRTFDRFARLFDGSQRRVTVECTDVQRTQDSRDMFIDGMISRGASQSVFDIIDPVGCDPSSDESMLNYANLRFFDVCPWYLSYENNNPLQAQFDVAAAEYSAAPIAELHSRLFAPEFTDSKSPDEKADFTSSFYSYSCATQVDTEKIYTQMCASISEESGSALGYVADLEDYISKGPVLDYPVVTDMSCLLIESLREDISSAILDAGAAHSAHLRFAHAETVIPVLGALGLVTEDPFIYANGGDYTQREFNMYYQSPMAANLMIAVLDCSAANDEGEYFVQLLHNEAVLPFPGCVDANGNERDLCPVDVAEKLLASKSCSRQGFINMCNGLACAE